MSARHGFGHRHLHVPGTSPVHRLAPHAKLAGLLAFVIAVALTPRTWVPAFAVDAAVVVGTLVVAQLPVRVVVTRLAAILPFIAFALLLPFIGDGATTAVGPLDLSTDGLWAMWNILAKATLGATASIILTATTTIPELLNGMARLRVPAAIVAIVGFMFRYLDLIVAEVGRMRRAMTARGYDPRWLWQSRPIATSAGTLFVRTYERGERVHDAMVARGYHGTMPSATVDATRRTDWAVALVPALTAAAGLVVVALT